MDGCQGSLHALVVGCQGIILRGKPRPKQNESQPFVPRPGLGKYVHNKKEKKKKVIANPVMDDLVLYSWHARALFGAYVQYLIKAPRYCAS